MYPNEEHHKYIKNHLPIRTDDRNDDMLEFVCGLRERNEHPRMRSGKREACIDNAKGTSLEIYGEEELPRLREKWYHEYEELVQGVPERMLTMHEINHEIQLIDPIKTYHYHLPRCPHTLREELQEKIDKYTRAG